MQALMKTAGARLDIVRGAARAGRGALAGPVPYMIGKGMGATKRVLGAGFRGVKGATEVGIGAVALAHERKQRLSQPGSNMKRMTGEGGGVQMQPGRYPE